MTASNFPKNVKLLTTTRFFNPDSRTCLIGGGYDNFNLATHTGDNPTQVEINRNLLIEKYNLPSAPKYLEQIHSNICLSTDTTECVGDAIVTDKANQVCLVMTADCLPIFASNKSSDKVGVAHAGWKGIMSGVIESFIKEFNSDDLVVHFGPAISQKNFEVGQEVFTEFVNKDKDLAQAFIESGNKYKLDIYQAARIILNKLGVDNISGGDECTYEQVGKYFSYRRDGAKSGRMANLIWFE